MKLWLVRHAQPLIAPGICYGASNMGADVSATRQSALALSEVLPKGLVVYFSPLQRCEQLAIALKWIRPDLVFCAEPSLVEMDFGCWEGVRWDAIPKAAIDAWTQDFASHRFGGKESVNELMVRVRLVLQSTAQSTEKSGSEAVWVTHAGVIRIVGLIAQGADQGLTAEQWPKAVTAFGQWTQVLV
jgi:alpha-ribazole phosphatase